MEKITSTSTKEEVASFFSSKFKISNEVKDNMIKEDISGVILLNMADNDFKKLGLKIGPIKKIQKYLSENKDNLQEIVINEKINKSSSVQEVKNFLEKHLGYEGEIILDGEKFLKLSQDDIMKMGLNLGQRKKLEKYLTYFNSIKDSEEEKINNAEEKQEAPKVQKEINNDLNKNDEKQNGDNQNITGQQKDKKKEEIKDDKKDEIKDDKKDEKKDEKNDEKKD